MALSAPKLMIFLTIKKSKIKTFKFFTICADRSLYLNNTHKYTTITIREAKVPYAAPTMPIIGNPNLPKMRT